MTSPIALTPPAAEPRKAAHLPARPRPPVASRVLAGLGRVLVAVGLVVLLFVAYQLWGTGLHHSRAQTALEARFEEQLAERQDGDIPAPGSVAPGGAAAGTTGHGQPGNDPVVGRAR